MTGSGDRTGTVVAGRYRLRHLVGTGRTADVHAADDLVLGRSVAVKLARTDDEALLAQARTCAGLDHPRLVRVLDAGRHGDRPFQVLELVDGVTVTRRLAAGPLRPADALAVADGVLAALEHAHAHGVLHLDLSPANVMLEHVDGHRHGLPDPAAVRLLDLGGTPVGDGSVGQGLVAVSPHYASPELATGQPGDARSDLYSLGALLHELLAGVPPFVDVPADHLLDAHVRRVPPPVSARLPVAPEVDALVARALAKAPADRFPDAAAMRAAVGRAAAARTPVLPVVRGAAAAVTWRAPEPAPAPVTARRPVPRPVPDAARGARLATMAHATAPPGVPHESARVPTVGAWVVAGAVLVGAVALGASVFGASAFGASVFGGSASGGSASGGADPARHGDAGTFAASASATAPAPTPGGTAASAAPTRAAPPTAASVPATVAVPEVVGSPFDDGRARLAQAGLVLGAVTVLDGPTPGGVVLGAHPADGEVPPGSAVDLDVASGYTIVLDVAGMAAGVASDALRAASVVVGGDAGAGSGLAVRTRPAAGSRVLVGSTVELVVEAGPTNGLTNGPTAPLPPSPTPPAPPPTPSATAPGPTATGGAT